MQPKPKRCVGPPPQYVHKPNYQQYKNGPCNLEVWLIQNNPSSLQPPRTPIMNACMPLGRPRDNAIPNWFATCHYIHQMLMHRHSLKFHSPLVQKLPPNLHPNPNG